MTVVARDYVLGHEGHEEYTKHTKPFAFFTVGYSIKNIYSLCTLWFVVFLVTIL